MFGLIYSGDHLRAGLHPDIHTDTALEICQKPLNEKLGEIAGFKEITNRCFLPLISQGSILGLLYGDMRQIFGRFNEADVQLLGMLAHQAASALANADLVSNLEERVDQRTAELAAAKEEAELAREDA